MQVHLDYNDPKYREAAEAILQRHNAGAAEANITSAIRDFLALTQLAKTDEMVEENSPALGSRQAVDLVALDTFIEVKRRIGTPGGFNPNPEYVQQLDGYLAESGKQGRVRMGVLTDGKHWLLRWPNAGPVKTALPYGFVFEDPERWIPLFEWLRNHALVAIADQNPTRGAIADRFGPRSPSYGRDIEALRDLYARHAADNSVVVKRRLWQNLLTAALGEMSTATAQLDHLFVRHTYLSAVIGMVVQARFGTDIAALAEQDTADLLRGTDFRSKTGLQGIVESDFFTWPTEVEGGLAPFKSLARTVAGFNWAQAPTDIAAILYETVIPPEERRQLGEYYTPDWLARAIVQEVVTDPLTQEVLDPACGSGTFIAEAVTHFLEAARRESLTPAEVLEWLRFSITGIDIHPVAVHLARAAWALAALPALQEARQAGLTTDVTAPIYLGDSLQLRYRNGELFSEQFVTVDVEDEANTQLVFPLTLVNRAEVFDALMGDIARAIERGGDPLLALSDHHITDPSERQTIEKTIAEMRRLHAEGRNHIWAYYTRNLVRPVALARSKVRVIVGNPPWLNYNKTKQTLRTELERQSKNDYGIWTGGRYATHQDVAGLFFTRSVDLYLRDGGVIGMVMPHSALQAGQYSRWRTGVWWAKPPLRRLAVNFGYKPAWDLEKLDPNTFFPVASSVVFAQRVGEADKETPLQGSVEQWLGRTGTAEVRRVPAGITDTSVPGGSPYASHSMQGAIIVPRCLFFVTERENTGVFQAGGTVTVVPRRGTQDKPPWRNLDLSAISHKAVETRHVFNVHLGQTLVPYATLEPLKAVLPLKRGDIAIPGDTQGLGGIVLGQLEYWMRDRWEAVCALWEEHKAPVNRMNLRSQLDYYGKLTAQLAWRVNPGNRPVRVVYSSSGEPTAALLHDHAVLIDSTLFWVACKEMQEAHYLLAIINSDTLRDAVQPFMAKGQFGARHLQKQLWKLPIPSFDASNPLHAEIVAAGSAAAAGVERELSSLRTARGDVSVTIARRELRAWLRSSPEGAAVEDAVGRLLPPRSP